VKEIPIEQISQLLETVADKLPRLAHELMQALYSEEAGRQMGRAVGHMYKELTEAGIPKEDALRMACDYMDTLKSIAKVLRE
jgi:hypothetical protein